LNQRGIAVPIPGSYAGFWTQHMDTLYPPHDATAHGFESAHTEQRICGFEVQHLQPLGPKFSQRAAAAQIAHWLQAHGVDMVWLDIQPTANGWQFHLTPTAWQTLTPSFDTLGLVGRLGAQRWSMELEIAVAMLASPVLHVFPSFDELCAHVDVRKNIGQAGKLTTLAFATETAERPDRYWTYAEDTGFTLKPGASLIDALTMATQPSVSGELFSFSCYRATEYVLLLGMAQTMQAFHPELLKQLEDQWQQKAIASGRFHDAFLTEVGSLECPLPHRFYVPGDRVWFRNPDEPSADVVGFEGSWVVYLGQGRFTDFWRPQSTYTLESKCLEIFYWRDAIVLQPDGEPMIDEAVVWERIAALNDPTAEGQAEKERIMARMMRYRDGRGIYAEGGCIDATREHPRLLCPHTTTVDFCVSPQTVSAPTPLEDQVRHAAAA
jgi:hypothetical protein